MTILDAVQQEHKKFSSAELKRLCYFNRVFVNDVAISSDGLLNEAQAGDEIEISAGLKQYKVVVGGAKHKYKDYHDYVDEMLRKYQEEHDKLNKERDEKIAEFILNWFIKAVEPGEEFEYLVKDMHTYIYRAIEDNRIIFEDELGESHKYWPHEVLNLFYKQPKVRLVRNAIKCNICGDIIESKYTHDFVQCKCGKCFVDGGLDYRRLSGDFEDLGEWA